MRRRRRIETIKAENYEDYLEQLNKIDEEYSKKDFQKKDQKKNINFSNDEDYFSLDYKMEKQIPSLEEREKIDEDNLIKNINLIKEEIQNSPLSISSMKTFDSDKNLKKFYLENFENFEKLKIVVIGKKKSGKTFFIENFENYDNNNKKIFDKNFYEPTISLEFKKKIFNNVKIEFIDTNENIINDCIIKTYYDLCNGIIIVSKNLKEDKNFIDNQIKIINKNEKILIFENNNNNIVNINQNLFNNINKINLSLFDFETSEKNKFNDFICKLINSKLNLNHSKNLDNLLKENEEINLNNENNDKNIPFKIISLLNEINFENKN